MQTARRPGIARSLAFGLGAGWLAAAALGCVSPSDPLAHFAALQEAQKRYTEAIRWGDIEGASRFVDEDLREGFLALADAFEEIRITDYEIGEVDLEPEEKRRAEVEVTYLGYALPFYVERKIRDRQVWHRGEGMGNDWRVRPELDRLIAAVEGRP